MHKFVVIFILVLSLNNAYSEFFSSKDGTKLFYTKSKTTLKPSKGSVFFVQGRSEFVDKYQRFFNYINNIGFDVYAMDLRGQGRSGGRRCYVDSYDQFSSDLSEFINLMRAKENIKKIILFSHSTGGLIVIKFLEENADSNTYVLKAVLSSPFLGINSFIPQYVIKLYTKARIYLGNRYDQISNYTVQLPFEKNNLTHDKEFYLKYYKDPLMCGKPTYGWLDASINAIDDVFNNVLRIKVPIFMLVSNEDTVVNPKNSIKLCTIYPKCVYKIYNNKFHELLNEDDNKEIYEDITKTLSEK